MAGSNPSSRPTVMYDSERAAGYGATDRDTLLAPPNIPELLRSKRVWYRRELPRTVQMFLMAASVTMSSLQANGIYCWGSYGPVVAKTLHLDTAQFQTIAVGGILGVYLCAAPIGAITDRLGPRAGSFLSALLAAGGYYTFAGVVADPNAAENTKSYLILTAAFFAVGAATVGSYFSALTTASLSFPQHPTLSLSVPLALLGLSPMFLSCFSNLSTFTAATGELNVPKYLMFLGTMAFVVNLFGSLFMKVILPEMPLDEDESDSASSVSEYGHHDYAADLAADLSASLHLDEHSPLLIGGPEAAREEVEQEMMGKDVHLSLVKLLGQPGFWIYGLILAFSIGPSETIFATIGSVLTSLLPPDQEFTAGSIGKLFSSAAASWTIVPESAAVAIAAEPSALQLRNKHVYIMSVCSTVARLVTGFLADRLSPAPVCVPLPPSRDPHAPTHEWVQRDPIRLSRSMFCAICTALLALVFAYNAAFLTGEPSLWVLSSGVGLLYGAVFTLTPSITSQHYGATNFGFAWGMVSYFPALGSAIFSYLYAYLAVSAVASDGSVAGDVVAAAVDGVCYGAGCFRTTFWISGAACLFSAVGISIVGRVWRV